MVLWERSIGPKRRIGTWIASEIAGKRCRDCLRSGDAPNRGESGPQTPTHHVPQTGGPNKSQNILNSMELTLKITYHKNILVSKSVSAFS